MSADARHILEGAQLWNVTLVAPLVIITGTALLVNLLGWPAFVGFGVYIVMFPVHGVIANMQVKYRSQHLGFMDTRIKVTNEVLQGIRSIKLFGWEASFYDTLAGIRCGKASVDACVRLAPA